MTLPGDSLRTGKRWVLFGGCPRSGTTLLGFLVNTHPCIRVTNELSLARMRSAIGELFYRERSVRGVMDRAKGKKENWTREDVLELTPTEDRCARGVLDAVFAGTFPDPEGRVRYWGDKLPSYYARDFDSILEFLPDLKVVHVSRDPYDVVNSMLRRSRNAREGRDSWRIDQTIEEAARDWAHGWNFIVERRRSDPESFLHVKYEMLVFEPDRELGRIAAFLGLEDEFDRGRIVTEHHHERDQLDEGDISEIDRLLAGLPRRWSEPLETLEREFPRIPTAEPRPQPPAEAPVTPPLLRRIRSRLGRVLMSASRRISPPARADEKR